MSVYLVGARFEIHVSSDETHISRPDKLPRTLHRAYLYERSIKDESLGKPLAEGAHRKRDKAIIGVLACALGDLLAERDPAACETCGARIGALGGRDAKTGRLVCFEHVTRRPT